MARFIYFTSNRSGRQEIWKIPSGGGQPLQVTRFGGMNGVESPDGRELYYSKTNASGLWRMPLPGGSETEVVKDTVFLRSWTLGRHGISYATQQDVLLARRYLFTVRTRTSRPARPRRCFRARAASVTRASPCHPTRQGSCSGRSQRGRRS